jgi:phospholipid-binding lipoprotein MlaA
MIVKSRSLLNLAIFGLAAGVSGCSSIPSDQRTESDPWESMNRSLFSVHTTIDKVSTKPLAKGYRAILPGLVRKGISNFFSNLVAPRSAINNFLQGKPGHGVSEIGRLVINSTIGVGGLIDIATPSGLEEHREDFGQTAAVWGVPDGPYVMLPFLGPHTLRDAVFLPVDIVVDPLYQYDNSSVRDKLYVLRLIDLRYRLLAADKFLDDSEDKYVTMRESYLQNREYEVYDGDPPEDDDFFDEFFEED